MRKAWGVNTQPLTLSESCQEQPVQWLTGLLKSYNEAKRAPDSLRPASPTKDGMLKASGHTWRFKARFRRHAFGWRSQPAIARLREAVSDQIPYIERLADCWGELCGSIEIVLAVGNCYLRKEDQDPALKQNYETAFELD